MLQPLNLLQTSLLNQPQLREPRTNLPATNLVKQEQPIAQHPQLLQARQHQAPLAPTGLQLRRLETNQYNQRQYQGLQPVFHLPLLQHMINSSQMQPGYVTRPERRQGFPPLRAVRPHQAPLPPVRPHRVAPLLLRAVRPYRVAPLQHQEEVLTEHCLPQPRPKLFDEVDLIRQRNKHC